MLILSKAYHSLFGCYTYLTQVEILTSITCIQDGPERNQGNPYGNEFKQT